MKIAFVVSFFDFRNDVRKVIQELSLDHEVVVFGNKVEEAGIKVHLPSRAEFRPIREKKQSVWNAIWERLYILFRSLPKSRHNYYLMELFKIGNLKSPAQRSQAHRILRWSQRLPKVISYDLFIKNLQCTRQTSISDIDQFIFFTAISSDYLLSRLIDERKKVSVYVYSWDHPCKHTCFSKKVRYLVWSAGMQKDLMNLQHIPEEQINIIGASQFCYVEAYRNNTLPFGLLPYTYLYYGCAIGIQDLVPEEVNVVKILAERLAEIQPDWKLLVRPYPVLSDWSLYDPLRQCTNVIFDEHFRTSDSAVTEQEILKKYDTIEKAEAFFHIGTTMGLEAGFTNRPSFILDFGYTTKKGLSLYNFIHQYQNDNHLISLAPQNAITSEKQLEEVLRQLSDAKFLKLNHEIQVRYHVKSFSQFSSDLLAML